MACQRLNIAVSSDDCARRANLSCEQQRPFSYTPPTLVNQVLGHFGTWTPRPERFESLGALPVWRGLTRVLPRPSNTLLALLPDSDWALIAPKLEAVELAHRQPIETANMTIEHAYFPTEGIISVVAKEPSGQQIEAGVVGREGMMGHAIVMSNHRSPNDAFVQVAGRAVCMSADDLRDALVQSQALRQLAQRFVQVFMTQVAQTALANGRAKIEERLARWLLMAQDRLDNSNLQLTHEFIALMLGVRRPGVTDAINDLVGKGLIRSSRGMLRVVDRRGLLATAGGIYGVPEAEYKRLIG
jgi:CRP-like cAMP-binding protein